MSGGRTSFAHSAITHDEADAAFAPLANFEALLIAVSGGPDSLALLYLLSEWVSRRLRFEPQRPAPRLFAATVDHRLRKESAVEAELVADHCARLGVPHETLVWNGPKPWSGIADGARRARYDLLNAHAETKLPHGKVAVVTAHTLDDQAETLLMRLKRGSGVEGLAAVPVERVLVPGSPVRLVRPLLSVPKTRLIGTLQERGILWCEDPTNDDAAFERVRVRTTLRMLAERGFEAEAFARTARRMQDAVEGLDYAEAVYCATLQFNAHDGLCATLDRAAFDAGPRLLRHRVLAKLIAAFGGASPDAELSEIEALVTRMDQDGEVAATLGGAMVKAGAKSLKVWREVGRIPVRPVPVTPGAPVLWDDRFRVSFSARAAVPELTVAALGPAAYRAVIDAGLGSETRPGLPVSVWHGVPALWAGPTLLAVPNLGVLTDDAKSLGIANVESEPIIRAELISPATLKT